MTSNQGAVADLSQPMAGCLLGYSHWRGVVSDSYATCAATATGADDAFDRAGGLVGWNAGTVRDSYATGMVASDSIAGGLVGFSSVGTALVTDSYATGAVSASASSSDSNARSYAGGLVGYNNAGADVIGSYATGAVSASGSKSYAGGLVGYFGNPGTQVRASYSIGAVSISGASGNSGNAGGLVGEIEGSASIVASYAAGVVSASGGGANYLGGLVGHIRGAGSSVTNSYWDTQTSGQTASAAGVGKTTSELQSPTGYTGIYANWNLNLDGQAGDDAPWYFGTASQYPALQYGGHDLHIQLVGDYDLDDDGLIEVDKLPRLDAVRWDLNGDGTVDTGTSVADTAKYNAAFAGALTGMGCLRDYDANTATAKVAGCIGYELTRDLDFDTNGDGTTYTTSSAGVVTGVPGDDYYNGGKGWKPIGNATNPFTATFAGNDKTIANLFIKATGSGPFGLFGASGTGGQIERLGILGVNVTGSDNVGGLVGRNRGTISASYVTGSVTGTYAGGLVGWNNGTISASYATSYATRSSHSAGGLAGGNSGVIRDSYATGSVTGTYNAGGLVSWNNGTISACYATGSVTGTSNVGGLVGYSSGTIINTSYATGSVTGTDDVGGLVGYNGATISASYATGSVIGADDVGGLVGYNGSTISASYATGSVTGTDDVGGLAGDNAGTISASYATGSVTGNTSNMTGAGGLAGHNVGAINGSYATGSVTGAFSVGGLVGDNWGGSTIGASYATGSVNGSTRVGGLVGNNLGTIGASYATGSVNGTSNVGGMVGSASPQSTVTASYWDTVTTGQATSSGGAGKTTSELQSPTGYSGIYATWNLNLDGVAGNDDPWDFGANGQYPALKYGGLVPGQQWPVSVSAQSAVNGNVPIVGGPVTATLDATGATGITWQWQSSADSSAWTDIANATGATYTPVTADAAGGGKHLRVKASLTAWATSRTATSDRTAKVVSNANAPVIAATSAPIVGEKLRYYLSAAGATHRTAWQWQRCDNTGMTTNCASVAASTTATAEYTPVAGDVGKYLQAHAYYAASDAGKTWTRTETPVLGPVVAAPAAAPSASQ